LDGRLLTKKIAVKERVVVIHQPDFMPYLGFFHRLFFCDVLVILDHVQLLKRGWHHRDKIKGLQGELWLTVPIERKNTIQKINEAKIDYGQNWIKKHLKRIRGCYQKATYFSEVYASVKEIYNHQPELLVDLNCSLLNFFINYFTLNVEIYLSSQMNQTTQKNQLLADISKKVGGNIYLTGTGSKDYIQPSYFERRGLELRWQHFTHPVYPQLHGAFIPNLSCLDFAMNCGSHLRKYLFEENR
jgi:hypothetical protein